MSKNISVSEARRNLFSLVRDVASGEEEPVTVSSQHGDAVIVSREEWESLQETMHLLSIPGLQQSIVEGLGEDIDELSSAEDLRRRKLL